MPYKVVFDFLRKPVLEKISIFLNILGNMKVNPDFTNPDIPYDEAQAAVDDLIIAQKETIDGGHSSFIKMHEAEKVADNAFRVLGNFVERKSNGVESVIVSTGFSVRKSRITPQKPDLEVKVGELSGTIDCVAHAIKGAGAYVWYSAVDTIPATKEGWIIAGHSKTTKITLSGFASGTILYITCAGILADGVTEMYQPVRIVVH